MVRDLLKIVVFLTVAIFFSGCGATVGVPVGAPVQEQVAEEETVEEAAEPAEAIEVVESPEPVAPVMTQFYDDPAMGWFIQGS